LPEFKPLGWDASSKSTREAGPSDKVLVEGFIKYGTQTVTGTATVNCSKVFCSGSGYTITMPTATVGDEVEIFKTDSSGFIALSSVVGLGRLYGGESVSATFDGSNWIA